MSVLHRPHARAAAIGFAATATVLLGGGLAVDALAATTSAPPSPDAGHSEVVAQSVIEFDGGPYHWALAHESVGSGSGELALAAGGPSFLVASGGALVVGDVEGTDQVRLASGEATFLAAGGESVMWVDEGEPSYYAIELIGGESSNGAAAGERSFSVGEGRRDVDLVRDVVSSGEALTISANDDLPVLVVVTDGAVNVASAGGGEDLAIGAGDVMLLDGALAITTIGAEPAAVIAVVIGPAVERDSDVPTITSASGTGPSAGPTAGGTTTTMTASTAGSTSTAVPSTSTATTGPSAPGNTGTVLAVLPTIATDFDGDGLSAAEEAAFGSNPNLADTDGDSLSDHQEYVLGTNPNLADTDGDSLSDGEEYVSGTSNPYYSDTDDDGVDDGAEVRAGTDPGDPNDY